MYGLCIHDPEKSLQMPDNTGFEMFNDIPFFLIHVIKQGYVAIDFYDGSIMYDFGTRRSTITDASVSSHFQSLSEWKGRVLIKL